MPRKDAKPYDVVSVTDDENGKRVTTKLETVHGRRSAQDRVNDLQQEEIRKTGKVVATVPKDCPMIMAWGVESYTILRAQRMSV